jgi:hypothetical protein
VAPLLLHVQVLSDEGARQAYNARLETALADEEDDYTGGQSCKDRHNHNTPARKQRVTDTFCMVMIAALVRRLAGISSNSLLVQLYIRM